MKSKYAQKFNHDPIATGYDNCVKNENNPIREGYQSLLTWIQEKTLKSKNIIDLGCGTGNTTNSLGNFEKVYCVDISENMLNIAKEKLKNKGNITFIKNDLLNFFSEFPNNKNNIDTIISTYAIHHLTQKEKYKLFKLIYNLLGEKGKIVFGDLMFENKNQEKEMRKKYPDLVEDFDDELYRNIEDEVNKLQEIGFKITIKKFSDLSWGIVGEK